MNQKKPKQGEPRRAAPPLIPPESPLPVTPHARSLKRPRGLTPKREQRGNP